MNTPEKHPGGQPAVPRPPRILIVEDERLVALSLGMQLRALGYDVVAQVPSGEEAIQAAEFFDPDLILMDIRLEGEIDGIQAATEIWRRHDVPIVYLTAFSDAETLARAKVTEPFGFILKPVNERELHVAIETSLYRHRMQLERTALQETHRRELDGRLESLATLAAGIAHEINNPIGSILLAAQRGLAVESQAREALASIVEDAKRCGEIVRNVLRFAREDPLEKQQKNLNDAVAAACEGVANYFRSRECVLRVNMEQMLPSLSMNSGAIEQVVENVLRNAADASAAGDTIDLRTEIVTNKVRIVVRDMGVGMPYDVLRRVCEPFFTTRRATGGTGLGLSISHSIVADHGGTVHFESAPGQGTTVTVEFPVEANS